ncbi:exosortase/archaeosortase family protein [Salinispirillum marinum]|uniref:Exosortase/archaeosortase family protein n=2 Tax=Saccharospirillaceae TaxID=255527 RepID=A0ABV8BAK5_9GAMM
MTVRKALHNIPLYGPYFVATVLCVVVMAPTWRSLWQQWLGFEQVLSHGLPSFLLFCAMLVIRPPGAASTRQPNATGTRQHTHFWLAVVALTATLSVWTLFRWVQIDTLAFFMLPVGLAALIAVLSGWSALWTALPHLFLLSLALPFWADVIDPLIAMASVVVNLWVGLFGMTALIEGSTIHLPWGSLVIADGCSGIRYLAIALVLGTLVAMLNGYRWPSWLITLTVAAGLALLMNWIRITALVVIGYQSQMTSSLMHDHELFGWLLFAAVCLPALYFAPAYRLRPTASAPVTTMSLRGICIALGLGVLILALSLLGQRERTPLNAWTLEHPIVGTTARSLPLPLDWPSQLTETHYSLANGTVLASLAQFQRPTRQEKMVPFMGNLYDARRWQARRDWQPQASTETAIAPLRLYRDTQSARQVLWTYWYQIGPFTTVDYRVAKLLQIPALLVGDERFVLVSLQARCFTLDCQAEAQRMDQALAQVVLK